jgi:N-methylhydantoinase A/oxoprolinase/acetone carboxylase beta subunit
VPIDPSGISLVALSTTLATNAVAEGKRKPVALVLLGYDPELVYKFKFDKQFGTPYYCFINGYHDRDGAEITPLDKEGMLRWISEVRHQIDAIAVSAYHGPINSAHEDQAGELLRSEFHIPVVQAHHLTSELDSIRRAATTSLNASLLSNLDEFTTAVRQMLDRYGVACPVMMVRGDGSIMDLKYARSRPVEMIHSGPATSAIGGQYLSRLDRGLVIDIGGTTTDLALVDRGTVQVARQAATVGLYRTCVNTIRARSFGLGGDSRITFDHWGNLAIGPERVVPYSRFCSLHHEFRSDLMNWLANNWSIHYSEKIEFWALRKELTIPVEEEKIHQIIRILKTGPQPFWQLRNQVGPIAPVMIRFLNDLEIIDRIALTPTDMLHASAQFSGWDEEIADLAVKIGAKTLGLSVEDFTRRIAETITRRISAEIIEFLSERQLSDCFETKELKLDRWLFEENHDQKNPFLGSKIFLKIPMIGIGAPAKIFLPPVAEALNAPIVFPEFYEVANAVGTVVGNVVVRQEAEVFPHLEGASIVGYYARAGSNQLLFSTYELALEHARNVMNHLLKEELSEAGAKQSEISIDEKIIWEGMIHLSGIGVGKPGI